MLALAVLLTSESAPAATTRHRRHHAKRSLAATPPVMAPAQAGLVIAWDPETHTFTMPMNRSLPLSAAERNAISRSLAGLVPVRHADGSVSVDLQGRFQEFAVVHLAADGKPVVRCLDDSAAARRALAEPLPVSSPLEDR